MRILLIDNSNTRTKFALANGDKLLHWRAIIPTPEISHQSLTENLAGEKWDVSIVSSVVPDKAAILAEFLKEKPSHQLTHNSKLPIGIAYPRPEQIGADRLANAVAANEFYGCPCIVLDFGTAVTFDVIGEPKDDTPTNSQASAGDPIGAQASAGDPIGAQASAGDPKGAQASYLGGVIAPGLASMTEGLAHRTALLPHIHLAEPKHAIGKSTEEAMLAGAVFGYRGLVREILSNLRKEMATDPIILATGGDAELITRGLPEITHLCPQLTLEGLRLIAQLNLPSS